MSTNKKLNYNINNEQPLISETRKAKIQLLNMNSGILHSKSINNMFGNIEKNISYSKHNTIKLYNKLLEIPENCISIIAAVSGNGKTTTCMDIVTQLLLEDRQVILIHIEEHHSVIYRKLLCSYNKYNKLSHNNIEEFHKLLDNNLLFIRNIESYDHIKDFFIGYKPEDNSVLIVDTIQSFSSIDRTINSNVKNSGPNNRTSIANTIIYYLDLINKLWIKNNNTALLTSHLNFTNYTDDISDYTLSGSAEIYRSSALVLVIDKKANRLRVIKDRHNIYKSKLIDIHI